MDESPHLNLEFVEKWKLRRYQWFEVKSKVRVYSSVQWIQNSDRRRDRKALRFAGLKIKNV